MTWEIFGYLVYLLGAFAWALKVKIPPSTPRPGFFAFGAALAVAIWPIFLIVNLARIGIIRR